MTTGEYKRSLGHVSRLALLVFVAVMALVMGFPTVRGGFVGGDDHRLVLNHVLVNHPSLSHAVKLFTISHRDLYQPLPLLSFQAEFAVAKAFGFFDEGADAGAWLFHLTNVVLHAANTVLVWAVVLMLQASVGRRDRHSSGDSLASGAPSDHTAAAYAIATIAALLFAVHPLQTEVIAWLNGRMMLLSTLFALASLLTLASWLKRPHLSMAALTIGFVLLSAISKVRIGLPILLLIVLVARSAKVNWRFALIWVVCAVVTGVLVLVNIQATVQADLFAQGAEHLRGPRIVRVVMALAWYFQHMVWPVGLASYYPTPPIVRWLDGATWVAMTIVVVSLALLGWACWRSRGARLGVIWFFATLASTLPIMPARNILAADRYMYLPIIGLLWLAASCVYAGYRRSLAKWTPVARRAAVGIAALAVLVPSISMGWHVASFYETPIRKTTRIATLFRDTPRVWEPLGWTLYSNGRYVEAMEAARMELRHDAPNVRSGAHQLLGMCELRRGNSQAALEHLHKAIEVDPDSGLGVFRLGIAHEELGRLEEATSFYETAVEMAPLHNPTINRLASIYCRLGLPARARTLYEKAIENNQYEVPAIMGLAELHIEEGTPESYLSAESRLLALLDWMPENTAALSNLGVVRGSLGRSAQAVEAYERALAVDAKNVTALLNLAQIHQARGGVERAGSLFERAVAAGLASADEAIAAHDFFVSQGDLDRAVALWEELHERFPVSTEVRALRAWTRALAGTFEQARRDAAPLLDDEHGSSWALATLAYIDLAQGRYVAATERTQTLCDMGDRGAEARQRLLGALERFDRRRPDVPWTFCLATQVLLTEGNLDAARVSVRLCEERCSDDACRERVETLRTRLQPRKMETP